MKIIFKSPDSPDVYEAKGHSLELKRLIEVSKSFYELTTPMQTALAKEIGLNFVSLIQNNKFEIIEEESV